MEQSVTGAHRQDIRSISVALFLIGGVLSSALVFIGGALSTLMACAEVIRSKSIPKTVLYMLPVFILAIPPIFWTEFTPYSERKIAHFFTVILISTITPVILIRTSSGLRTLFAAVGLMGLGYAVSVIPHVMFTDQVSTRISAFEANPIWFARSVGLAAIWFWLRAFDGRSRQLLNILAGITCLVVMIASGSRGPTLFLIGSLALSSAYCYTKRKSFLRAIVIVTLICVVLASTGDVLLSQLNPALNRFKLLLSQDPGASIQLRREGYGSALQWALENPIGLGYGGFEQRFVRMQYPHNLILESFVEGGWLFGFALIGVFMAAIVRGLRLTKIPGIEHKVLFTALIFSLMNAMVSGDLTSPKDLFVFTGIALGIPIESNNAEKMQAAQQ